MAQVTVEQARKSAQAEWVKNALEGTKNTVVIVPIFVNDKKKGWIPTEDFIRPSKKNPLNGALLLASFSTGSSSPTWLRSKFDESANFVVYATLSGTIEKLEVKYSLDETITGRIDTAFDSQPGNPTDLEQDLWFANQACLDAGIVCQDEDGNDMYKHSYLQRDLKEPVPVMPTAPKLNAIARLSSTKK